MIRWDDVLDMEVSIRRRTKLVCQQCDKEISLGETRTNYHVGTDTVIISFKCHGEEESYSFPHVLYEEMRDDEAKTVVIDLFHFETPNTARLDIAGLIWEMRDA